MPSPTDGLKVFLRKGEVEIDEWLHLLEARANLLRPHLDSITLPELKRLKCLRMGTFEHDLSSDNFNVETVGDCSLRMQGIFRVQHWENVERIPGTGFAPAYSTKFQDGIVRAWGLTRKGKWVLITILFSGQPGHKEHGYEKPEFVKIEETDLVTILTATKEKPERIWLELGKEVRAFVEHRKRLLWTAERLESVVEAEESAYYLAKNSAK